MFDRLRQIVSSTLQLPSRFRSARVPPGSKLNVGCGESVKAGYIGCDLRRCAGVQLVCKAWEISRHCHDLAEIFSRHMLEHLTWREAEVTLRDWRRALADDGQVHLVVPNLDFALQQWKRAEWTDEAWETRWSDGRWGFANLFGWQRECDPEQPGYSPSYWDVHKSGYNEQIMTFLLRRAGFEEIEISYAGFSPEESAKRGVSVERSAGCHLIAKGRKRSLAGEKGASPAARPESTHRAA